MAIKPKAVLQALDRCHDGVLQAADTDAAIKLLRSMRVRDGLISELRERLREMADTNQVVIECEGTRFNLIAIPEKLEATDTKDGETMATPKGMRMTTYARTGDGKELPSHLRDEHVGPLRVTYKDPAAGEAIATAAELVLEEIVKTGKPRHGRDELLATIQGILLPLYDGKAEVAQTLAMPVLCFLVDNGHAKRVPVPGRRRDEIIIEITLPETGEAEVTEVVVQTDFDPIEMLARLAPELEAARARLAELEQLLKESVDPETVRKITERGEELQTEKEELQRKLDAAGSEKDKILEAQKARLAKLRSDHTAALAKLRREHEAALATIRRELETVRSEKAALEAAAAQKPGVDPELQQRIQKLLGN